MKGNYHVEDEIELVGKYEATWEGQITVPKGTRGKVTCVKEKSIQARMDCKRHPIITIYGAEVKARDIPDIATTSEKLIKKLEK